MIMKIIKITATVLFLKLCAFDAGQPSALDILLRWHIGTSLPSTSFYCSTFYQLWRPRLISFYSIALRGAKIQVSDMLRPVEYLDA